MEKLAIVILNWNGRKMLDQYLSSVLQYSRKSLTSGMKNRRANSP